MLLIQNDLSSSVDNALMDKMCFVLYFISFQILLSLNTLYAWLRGFDSQPLPKPSFREANEWDKAPQLQATAWQGRLQRALIPRVTSTLILLPLYVCLTVNAMTTPLAKYCETHKTKVRNEERRGLRVAKENQMPEQGILRRGEDWVSTENRAYFKAGFMGNVCKYVIHLKFKSNFTYSASLK